ncbi:hypothetical protein GINT2_000419 [Glugoides intestinalis]
MDIKGLKLENDAVFVIEEKSKEWERGENVHVKYIEMLLKKMDFVKFAKKNIRENIIFENEVKVGFGSVKSHKDQDGDLIYTFQRDLPEKTVQLDEDSEFWNAARKKPENNEKRNFWAVEIPKSNSSAILSHSIEPNSIQIKRKKASREIYDVSVEKPIVNNESLIKKTFCVHIKNEKRQNDTSEREIEEDSITGRNSSQQKRIADYKFIKRKKANGDNKLKLILMEQLSNFKRLEESIIKKTIVNKGLSFIKRNSWTHKRRKEGGLYRGILRYKKMYSLKNELESKFYLKPMKKTPLADAEFEKLLKDTINSNV